MFRGPVGRVLVRRRGRSRRRCASTARRIRSSSWRPTRRSDSASARPGGPTRPSSSSTGSSSAGSGARPCVLAHAPREQSRTDQQVIGAGIPTRRSTCSATATSHGREARLGQDPMGDARAGREDRDARVDHRDAGLLRSPNSTPSGPATPSSTSASASSSDQHPGSTTVAGEDLREGHGRAHREAAGGPQIRPRKRRSRGGEIVVSAARARPRPCRRRSRTGGTKTPMDKAIDLVADLFGSSEQVGARPFQGHPRVTWSPGRKRRPGDTYRWTGGVLRVEVEQVCRTCSSPLSRFAAPTRPTKSALGSFIIRICVRHANRVAR